MGHVDRVDGEGVVGKFPVLRVGGYRNDQQNRYGNVGKGKGWTDGTFVYQSCSGPKVCFHANKISNENRIQSVARAER